MSSKIGSKTSVFHDYFLSRKTVIKVPARKNRFDLGLGTLYKELGFTFVIKLRSEIGFFMTLQK